MVEYMNTHIERFVVRLSDEDRDLLRQIVDTLRDRLPAPATENDYQAVTTPIRLREEQDEGTPLWRPGTGFTHP